MRYINNEDYEEIRRVVQMYVELHRVSAKNHGRHPYPMPVVVFYLLRNVGIKTTTPSA